MKRPRAITRRRWSAEEEHALRLAWGEVRPETLLQRFPGRTWQAIWQHAVTALGLPRGVPQGHETLRSAAKRTGYSTHQLWEILGAANVRVPLLVRRRPDQLARRRARVPPEPLARGRPPRGRRRGRALVPARDRRDGGAAPRHEPAGEAGTLYRSAGWGVAGLVEASDAWHSRPGRTIMQGGPKVRWEAGPDARADGAAALVAGMCVGRVEIPARREVLPLFARCA